MFTYLSFIPPISFLQCERTLEVGLFKADKVQVLNVPPVNLRVNRVNMPQQVDIAREHHHIAAPVRVAGDPPVRALAGGGGVGGRAAAAPPGVAGRGPGGGGGGGGVGLVEGKEGRPAGAVFDPSDYTDYSGVWIMWEELKVKEVLGKGNFGEVRRVLYHGGHCVVKLSHKTGKEHIYEILKEASAASAATGHPNVCPFYGVTWYNSKDDMGNMAMQLGLVTEYVCAGETGDCQMEEGRSGGEARERERESGGGGG
jgi:hypothetical protein